MKLFVFSLSFILFLTGCQEEGNDDPRSGLNLPEDVAFTHLPTDLSRMLEFGAIGQINVIPKAHGGFGVKDYYSPTPDIPVYAMSDGIIYNIRYEARHYEAPFAPDSLVGKPYDDYTLHIYISQTAEMHFGHLSKLAPEILEQAGNLEIGTTENDVRIPIREGQVLANIGTHPGFDVGLYDVKKEHYFANPDRYSIDYRSAIPFTDFLPENLREKVWEINPRTVEPLGGKINYDLDGTISGNWFLEGTTGGTTWENQLIIAYHERYADRITIADASPQKERGESNIWWIIGNQPYPEEITPESGKVKLNVATWYKFATTDTPPSEGIILIELTEDNFLNFEYFPGELPENVEDFTSNMRVYER